MIITNQVSEVNPVFGVDENSVVVLQKNGEHVAYPLCSKQVLAEQLVDLINSKFSPHPALSRRQ